MNRLSLILIILLTCPRFAPGQSSQASPISPTVTCTHGVVVCVSPIGAEAGRSILQSGGNAVDAAVATAFALAVVWPEAGNIGGGGFMLVYPGHGKDPQFFDYRETAPAGATVDMFAHGHPDSFALVGVPGTIRGLELSHHKLGKLPWNQLVQPAINLARNGVVVDAALARSLNSGLRSADAFPEFKRIFGKDGDWRAGDRLVQPDLADTLQQVADHGADAFYTGEIAKKLVASVAEGHGMITPDDLRSYQARERTPVHGTYHGFDVYSAPPPSSGGVALVEMLNVLENFTLHDFGRYDPRTLHLMIEAMRRAYCDRAQFLGDPDFTHYPPHLIYKTYAKQLAGQIDLNHATRSADLARQDNLQISDGGPQTTHFSVIDSQGMAVSNTYTLEQSFGGKIVVKGAGFLLNNEMGDFNPRPGITTSTGIIGTPPNQLAPGKRMLSSMTPTIVARDGRPLLITGSPGSRTIINTVLCVTLNVTEFKMPLREAVDAPRMHHAWFPDDVTMEPMMFDAQPDAITRLRAMGHAIAPRPAKQGDAHSIYIDPATGQYTAAADTRIGGAAAGY
jgi:gamma-glutamyltranspeptidase/glutathione hydrolase